MKGQVAVLLIVVALIIGAGIDYFGNTAASKTTTETVIKTDTTTVETYTTTYPTTSINMGVSGVAQCIVTEYHVWAIEEITTSSSTIRATSTQSYVVLTYQTSTVEPTVGFQTTSTTFYSGTLTGAIAYWNSTTCTLISG